MRSIRFAQRLLSGSVSTSSAERNGRRSSWLAAMPMHASPSCLQQQSRRAVPPLPTRTHLGLTVNLC